MFEDLVLDILLARGFSNDGVTLPCNPLGVSTTEVLPLKMDEYFISKLKYHHSKQNEVNAKLVEKMARCTKLKLTLLLSVPKGLRGRRLLGFLRRRQKFRRSGVNFSALGPQPRRHDCRLPAAVWRHLD